MWSTPAATAARSTRSASSRSCGGPMTPSPASCIAPNRPGARATGRARRTRRVPVRSRSRRLLSVRPRAGPCPGPLRLPSRVDLRAETLVEADRLEDVERGAVRVDVGGGQDAGVLLDDRRSREGDLRGLERLDRGTGVVPVP